MERIENVRLYEFLEQAGCESLSLHKGMSLTIRSQESANPACRATSNQVITEKTNQLLN